MRQCLRSALMPLTRLYRCMLSAVPPLQHAIETPPHLPPPFLCLFHCRAFHCGDFSCHYYFIVELSTVEIFPGRYPCRFRALLLRRRRSLKRASTNDLSEPVVLSLKFWCSGAGGLQFWADGFFWFLSFVFWSRMLKTSKALSVGEGLHTMFPHGEDAKEDNIQFSWGQQIGVAGANGDFHLYESFTYDGVEYFLYDCVFILRDGETEPDIGKLVKIWETASGKRRVKIVWFFQPPEIQNWLGDIQPLDNEIFLASGEGKGLFNLNPLESISGKCNVVCTSNDKRNQQPSKEQVMAADYIFFRSFDVGNCKISLSFPKIIAGTEVKNFLNRDNYRKPSTLKIRISSRDVHATSVDRSLARNGQTSCNQSDMRHANANFSLTSSSDPRPLKKRTLQFNTDAKAELSKGVVEKYRRISEVPVARAEPDRIPTNKSSQFMEVTRRPEKDTSWFKPQPWEEKVSLAHGRGTIVLLENLDPSFTSSEVEDIVWHAFKVKADAKMVQRRAFSSPYYGQALVIFRSSEAAERAISEMRRKCLMMSTGRPIVGRKAPPLPERDSNKFVGHLEIEKLRYQKQRKEMKNAVSTSHYSQPNTIEYEMAVEWRALQAKSDLCYKALYEQQRKEIRALRQQLEEVV